MKKRKSNHTCNDDLDTKKKPKKKNGFDSINDDTKLSSVSNHHHQQQQHPTTISITKEDHDKILQLLQSIDWDMAKNTSRRNVIRQDDPNTPKLKNGTKGNKPYCQSFIFGRNMKDPVQSLSYWSTQYPYIYQEFQNLIQKYNHQFTYTHITVNKNLQCKRHTDGGNAGLSYIIGFGNYTGGELQIDDVSESSISSSSSLVSNHTTTKSINTKTKVKTKIYNIYRTFVLFNGKLQPHETLSFTGERYTIVYYTSDIVPKVYNHQHHHPNTTNTTIDTTPSSTTIATTTTINDTIQVSETLTAKFNAMRKKLGRKR